MIIRDERPEVPEELRSVGRLRAEILGELVRVGIGRERVQVSPRERRIGRGGAGP